MMKVSLTSVVTNWNLLENCWTSSRTSSSPRSATRSLCCSPSLNGTGPLAPRPLVRGGFSVCKEDKCVVRVFVLGKRKRAYVNSFDQ